MAEPRHRWWHRGRPQNPNYPASNLANPDTSSLWKSGSTSDQQLVFTVAGDDGIDAVGIARHNFGSGAVLVTIEGLTAEEGASYEQLAQFTPGSDAPILAIFEAGYYVSIRISLEPGDIEPQAAVVYVGTLLRTTKGVPFGFTPPEDAERISMLGGYAENGDFLGDVILSQHRSTAVSLRPMDGAFYRERFRPFLQQRAPFFFAWSPMDHPAEVDFSKFEGDPQRSISQANGRFDVSFNIRALAL